MVRLLPSALVALGFAVAPTTGSAQQAAPGTAVMRMRITMPTPDSTATAPSVSLPFDELEMQLTYATDGQQLAMQMQFGEAMNMPGMALGEMLFHAIWNPTTDSVHVGVLMPADLVAQMGGGIGFRLDLAMPDSVALPGGIGDSLTAVLDTITMSGRDLGRTSTVGGVPCEEWEMFTGADTAQVCLAPTPPAIAAANRLLTTIPGMQAFGVAGLTERQRALFGGRDLMPLRLMMGRDGARIEMELLSSNTGMPDATLFVLSPDLDPFPIEMITGLMSQMGAGGESSEPQ